MNEPTIRQISIIGFGEVGAIFGRGFAAAGADVRVYDCLFSDPNFRGHMLEKAKSSKVRVVANLQETLRDTELVISATTASSAAPVARQAAAFLQPGQVYVDVNSVSPETKIQIGEEIACSGADFVEAAVMAAVSPQGLKVPILLGGLHAAEISKKLRVLGMDTTPISEKIGVASAIKMCRSIVMKGLAALAIESLFTARRYGAEDAVIASFEATYPGMGWASKLPDSLTRRSVEHSRRRAAEMREVGETLKRAGMNPFMALSTAALQDWLTRELEARQYVFKESDSFSWQAIADVIAGTPRLKA